MHCTITTTTANIFKTVDQSKQQHLRTGTNIARTSTAMTEMPVLIKSELHEHSFSATDAPIISSKIIPVTHIPSANSVAARLEHIVLLH